MALVEVAQAGGDHGRRVTGVEQAPGFHDAPPTDVLHRTQTHVPAEHPRKMELAHMRFRCDQGQRERLAEMGFDVRDGASDGTLP